MLHLRNRCKHLRKKVVFMRALRYWGGLCKGVAMVFGGGGAMHGTALAAELGINKVLVPAAAGVFSAFGMLMSDLRREHAVVNRARDCLPCAVRPRCHVTRATPCAAMRWPCPRLCLRYHAAHAALPRHAHHHSRSGQWAMSILRTFILPLTIAPMLHCNIE